MNDDLKPLSAIPLPTIPECVAIVQDIAIDVGCQLAKPAVYDKREHTIDLHFIDGTAYHISVMVMDDVCAWRSVLRAALSARARR